MKVTNKMVKVLSNDIIYPKGGISGPILTPYMEDVRTIFIMITRNIKVVEVLSDGSEVVLNTKNFDAKITPDVIEEIVEPIVETKVEVVPVIEEIKPVIAIAQPTNQRKKPEPDAIEKK